jgi:hypothetical protein
MVDEIRTWLKDIEQAILEINSFLPETKNFKDFQKDLVPQSLNSCQLFHRIVCTSFARLITKIKDKMKKRQLLAL